MNTTLHAIWLPATPRTPRGELCLWAEGVPRPASRRGKAQFDHPFALGASQILHLLWQLWRELPSSRLAETARKIPLVLPSLENRPLRSSEELVRDGGPPTGRPPARRRKSVDPVLLVWRADALVLPPSQALTFLVQVPANVTWITLGPSARYWQRAAYLAAAAIVRGQFLPSADEQGNGRWQVLLMETESQAALARLAQTMPASARAIAQPLLEPTELLNDFVAATVHDYVSQGYTPGRSPFYDAYAYVAKPHDPQPADFWWLDLFPRARHNLRTLKRPPEQIQFAQRIREWALPSYTYLNSPLRIAFRLEPPTQITPSIDPDAADWRLSFHLQPKDQPETLWAAGEIWDNTPQPEMPELLRAGLAQAARVYPRLATALENACPEELWLNVAEAVRFLETVAEELSAQGFGVLVPAWWKDRKRRLSASLALKQSESSGLFGLNALVDFDWKLAVGDTALTPQELEQLAQAKTALVQVRGEWVQFDPLEVQAALKLVQRHQKSGGKLSLQEALGLALSGPGEWEGLDIEAVRLDAWFEQLIERLSDHHRLEHLCQPGSFVGHLRPYQENGLSWLAFMRQYGFGACLADDMGLGKTIQVLALLTKDFDEQQLSHPILLVCPTTVVNNWVREAEKFAPELKCYAHHGPDRLKKDAFVAGVRDHHVVITSYALLPRDAEFLQHVPWGGVVLDEAHNIKNPVTKQAQIVRKLPAAYRVALTGTPLENRLQDLWSIMHFLNPGYLGSAESFQRRFAGPIERVQDERAARRLRAITGPFILRRLKTDKTIIQDLPPKNEMKEFCGLTKEQAALYKAVVNESLRQIAAANGIQRRGIILATLTKLKQVCNHPRHLLGDHSALKHRSGKLNRLTEMLEQALAEEDRVLIFTQYAEMGELLREHLVEMFGETLYLHGGTPAKKRAEMIEQFQDGGPRLFVLSLKAGGAGINLTRANRVFHFDRWWNPAVENQATDRAFRIGQSRAVQVHKMVCRGTLEEHIDELITRKMALAEQIVGSGEGWLTELSTDELRDLLVLRREALDE